MLFIYTSFVRLSAPLVFLYSSSQSSFQLKANQPLGRDTVNVSSSENKTRCNTGINTANRHNPHSNQTIAVDELKDRIANLERQHDRLKARLNDQCFHSAVAAVIDKLCAFAALGILVYLVSRPPKSWISSFRPYWTASWSPDWWFGRSGRI